MMSQAFGGAEHQPFLWEGSSDCAALCVHGFPGSPKEMIPVAKALLQAGWTVQSLLLPGFGPEIETLPQKSHQDWLEAVSSSLRVLREEYQTIVVVGNSMGGALTIEASARCDVDGVILFAPFYKVDHIVWSALPVLKFLFPRIKPFRLFKPDFSDPEFQKGARNFFPDANFSDPVFQRKTLEMELHTRVFDHVRRAGIAGFRHAPLMKAPALVIQGVEDELVKPKATQKLLSRLGGEHTYVEISAPHDLIEPEAPYWPEVLERIHAFASEVRATR